jgi:predicted secreted protein
MMTELISVVCPDHVLIRLHRATYADEYFDHTETARHIHARPSY